MQFVECDGMKDDAFILDRFSRIDKNIVLLGLAGAVCAYLLHRKIRRQAAEIEKLSQELKYQKGD